MKALIARRRSRPTSILNGDVQGRICVLLWEAKSAAHTCKRCQLRPDTITTPSAILRMTFACSVIRLAGRSTQLACRTYGVSSVTRRRNVISVSYAMSCSITCQTRESVNEHQPRRWTCRARGPTAVQADVLAMARDVTYFVQ